jgi:muramoyltetrapeptide carboxypeptidase
MITFPPYLKKGDTIGITCPGGYMPKQKAQACIETLQQWGFEVMVGKTLGSNSANYFSGDDDERKYELQAMLDDSSIKAILCGRGGYGTGRIIDELNFTKFKKNPKWIIGFSDITVLHCHLNHHLKVASIHGPMAAAFNENKYKNDYVESMFKMITGKKVTYKCNVQPFNKPGTAIGELVGGNLALLTHLIGTASDINTKNKILFLEDIGEQLYNIDRMMYQLKRSGKLKNLAGLILGGFTDLKDTERSFGKNIDDILKEIIGEYDYPVCYHFPVSHEKENYALKIGGTYQLKVSKKVVQLLEL